MKSYIPFGNSSGAGPSTTVSNQSAPFSSNGVWAAVQTTAFKVGITPSSFTITKMKVVLGTAPGVGASWTFDVRIGTTQQAINLVISDTATTGEITVSTAITAGNSFKITSAPSAGTAPAATTVWGYLEVEATSSFPVMTNRSGTQNTTTYMGPMGYDSGSNATENLVSSPIPIAGTIQKLYGAITTGAIAGGTSYTLTLYKNGSATALTVNLPDQTITGDTTHSVSIAAGDTVSIEISSTGSPTGRGIAAGFEFVPTTSGESCFLFSNTANMTNSATRYNTPIGGGIAYNATETNAYILVPATSFPDLYIKLAVAPAAGKSYQFVVDKTSGGSTSATALNVTVSDANTTNNITGQTVTTADGDYLSLKIVPSGTPTVSQLGMGIKVYNAPPGATATYSTLAMMGVG